MTSLIINLPHLQNRRQRYGAVILSALCWAWFLMPLAIVVAWLMGLHVAQGVVWLGGWQSLLRLCEFAVTMIGVLTTLWIGWTVLSRHGRRPRGAPIAPAIDAAFALGAHPADVAAVINAQVTTVYFDALGRVTRLEAASRRPWPQAVARRLAKV